MRQIDSLIRFSESVKSLRDERTAFEELLKLEHARLLNEQNTRKTEMANYQQIISGYAAIEQSKNDEIKSWTKKYKGQVRKNRVLFILFVAASSFGIYQTLK